MCGINGLISYGALKNGNELVARMNSASAHRGPDFTGIYSDDYISLGHNRLSIIDLSDAANQPFISGCGNFVIVFNGEVYNYREVREQLTDYLFKTDSDTEVVLAAYLMWGTDCLSHFNGMFAFAVWDKVNRKVFLARDRMGIKPLYFASNNDSFIFSSEIRSILASGLIKKKINNKGLQEYLMYATVHAPDTLIEGVQMLMPGHFITICEDEIEINSYWELTTVKNTNLTREEAKIKIRSLLEASVKRRLVADVPFGAFLSGGIDSSAVVALMSKVSKDPVKTFCVTFDEGAFSEAVYAKKIAQKFKTDHTEILVTPQKFLELLPEALDALDHPSGDGPNSFIVSKVTKESGVTMALSGLGGDELFAGYEVFKRSMSLSSKRWLFSFPPVVRKLAGKILKVIKPSVASDKIADILGLKYLELPYFYPINRQVLSERQLKEICLISNPVQKVKDIGIREVGVDAVGKRLPFLSKVSTLEISTYMQNVLLRDTDQMSMAHALEVRVPFLDHELVEFVLSVADSHKFPHSPKQFLVESLGDLLPDEVVNRPKMGFVLPYEVWMKNELRPLVEKSLVPVKRLSVINEIAIDDLWHSFLKGDKRVTWSKIWHIAALGHWLEKNEICE